MYALSKIIWFFLSPINFIIILFLISFFLKLFKYNKFSKFFLFLSFLFFLLAGIFPTGHWLLYKLETNYQSKSILPYELDGLLILGGPSSSSLTRIHNQVNFNDGGERLTESVLIIKKYKPKTIIFSGGSSDGNFENSHAYVAKIFFSQMEIDTKKIIFEYKSRNTFENIINSFKIANPNKNEKWLIITSSFHMTRAINIAKKINWNIIPYPVDFKVQNEFNSFRPSIDILNNFNSFNLASHEYIGLISYYLLGRTDKII
tara:strand:+ start:175 stop:954 length:780 start_codon:yes stop_codon:yes gene_type:complete